MYMRSGRVTGQEQGVSHTGHHQPRYHRPRPSQQMEADELANRMEEGLMETSAPELVDAFSEISFEDYEHERRGEISPPALLPWYANTNQILPVSGVVTGPSDRQHMMQAEAAPLMSEHEHARATVTTIAQNAACYSTPSDSHAPRKLTLGVAADQWSCPSESGSGAGYGGHGSSHHGPYHYHAQSSQIAAGGFHQVLPQNEHLAGGYSPQVPPIIIHGSAGTNYSLVNHRNVPSTGISYSQVAPQTVWTLVGDYARQSPAPIIQSIPSGANFRGMYEYPDENPVNHAASPGRRAAGTEPPNSFMTHNVTPLSSPRSDTGLDQARSQANASRRSGYERAADSEVYSERGSCNTPPPNPQFAHRPMPTAFPPQYQYSPYFTPQTAPVMYSPYPWSPYSHYEKSPLGKPKIEKFEGDKLDYPVWRRAVEKAIAESTEPEYLKFSRLRKLLGEEPKKMIKSLGTQEGEFEIALAILDDEYKPKDEPGDNPIRVLENWPRLPDGSLKNLKSYRGQVRLAIGKLRAEGQTLELSGKGSQSLLRTVVQKLPEDLVDKFHEYRTSREKTRALPTLKEFLDYKIEVLHAREVDLGTEASIGGDQESDKDSKRKKKHEKVESRLYHSNSSSDESVESNSNNTSPERATGCVVCSSPEHWQPGKCPKFHEMSVNDRWKIVDEQQFCKNCLRGKHDASKCLSSNRCRECDRPHNTLLHRVKPTPALRTRNLRTPSPSRVTVAWSIPRDTNTNNHRFDSESKVGGDALRDGENMRGDTEIELSRDVVGNLEIVSSGNASPIPAPRTVRPVPRPRISLLKAQNAKNSGSLSALKDADTDALITCDASTQTCDFPVDAESSQTVPRTYINTLINTASEPALVTIEKLYGSEVCTETQPEPIVRAPVSVHPHVQNDAEHSRDRKISGTSQNVQSRTALTPISGLAQEHARIRPSRGRIRIKL